MGQIVHNEKGMALVTSYNRLMMSKLVSYGKDMIVIVGSRLMQ
jgi:hypothetical protein